MPLINQNDIDNLDLHQISFGSFGNIYIDDPTLASQIQNGLQSGDFKLEFALLTKKCPPTVSPPCIMPNAGCFCKSGFEPVIEADGRRITLNVVLGTQQHAAQG